MTTIKSILPKVLQGVVAITGPFGVGKSTLAAGVENPANVVYIDFDDKGEILDEQLHFHSFYPMGRLASEKYGLEYTPYDLYKAFQDVVNGIEPGPTTVIIDNVSPMEIAFAAEVMLAPAKYGVNKANAEAGRFGGPSSGVKVLISKLINSLKSKGIQVIVVTSHVGQVWQNSAPVPNKLNAKGSGMWKQLSVLELALLPSSKTPQPDALVLKEGFGIRKWDDESGALVSQKALPPKIPACDFAVIRKLIKNPMNMEKLPKEYKPSEAEKSLYSAELSETQLAFIKQSTEAALAGLTGDPDNAPPPVIKKVEAVAGEIKSGDWTTFWGLAEKSGRKKVLLDNKAGKSFADMCKELDPGLKVI